MKLLLSVHVLTSVLISLLISVFYTSQQTWSFFVGAVVMALNILLLGIVFKLTFEKKLIVFPVNIIVFKYAFMGWAIYFLVTNGHVSILFFGLGIGSLIVTSFFYGLITLSKNSRTAL